MRTTFISLVLISGLLCSAHCEEVIPGVVSFDPPAFLHGSVSGNHGEDASSRISEVREYVASDNGVRTGERLIMVNLREVGFSVGPGEGVTYQKLDDQGLHVWMQNMIDSTRNTTNATKVADANVGGQAALFASYAVAQPNWPKQPGALFPFEIYWIRIQTNRVVEIKLLADSPEHLETLRPCLAKFQIRKSAD